jgi:precorrin-6B methylase 2
MEKVKADALAYLKSLEPESVKIINSDATFMTEEARRISTQVLGASGTNNIFLERYIIRAMKRALAPTGRIIIKATTISAPSTARLLEKEGFK